MTESELDAILKTVAPFAAMHPIGRACLAIIERFADEIQRLHKEAEKNSTIRERRPMDVVNERSLSVLAGMDDDPPPVEPLADEDVTEVVAAQPTAQMAAYTILPASWMEDDSEPASHEQTDANPPCEKCGESDSDVLKCPHGESR